MDGLKVNGPAVIDARLLHGRDNVYVHLSVEQTATGWPIPLLDLEPINRMFTHGRGATTCSMCIQGNTSTPYRRGVKATVVLATAASCLGAMSRCALDVPLSAPWPFGGVYCVLFPSVKYEMMDQPEVDCRVHNVQYSPKVWL